MGDISPHVSSHCNASRDPEPTRLRLEPGKPLVRRRLLPQLYFSRRKDELRVLSYALEWSDVINALSILVGGYDQDLPELSMDHPCDEFKLDVFFTVGNVFNKNFFGSAYNTPFGGVAIKIFWMSGIGSGISGSDSPPEGRRVSKGKWSTTGDGHMSSS